MTNAELIKDYIAWLKARGRVGVTTYNYASLLARYHEWLGETPLERVSLARMEAFVGRPRKGGEAGAPATQAKDVAILRAMYSYLVNRGHIGVNPAVLLDAPRVRNVHPKPIPDDEWVELWKAADDGPERAFLGLGFFVGLRRREVCELHTTQVFPAGGRLVSFKRKGGGDDITPYTDLCTVLDERLPHLGATIFPKLLDEYHEARSGHTYLLEWGEQVPAASREQMVHDLPANMTDPGLLNRRMSSLCERAGVSSYTPHQLRHSFVTNLLRAGVPLHLVSRMANHSTPTVTSRYIKAGTSELREWLAGMVNRHA